MTWWQKKPYITGINAYDKISKREQQIILVTVTITILLLGYLLLIEPLLLHSQRIYGETSRLEQINKNLSTQIIQTRENQYQNPNDPLREKLKQVIAEAGTMQEKINFLTKALVAPKQMVNLLEKVLTQDKQLKLISLINLPEQAMNIDGKKLQQRSTVKEGNNKHATEALIYQHAFEVELESTYGSTVSYLKRLDNLPWQLFWQSLKYESSEYPKGRLKIKIYTLSTSKEVLGV